jgi:hypothetical protein
MKFPTIRRNRRRSRVTQLADLAVPQFGDELLELVYMACPDCSLWDRRGDRPVVTPCERHAPRGRHRGIDYSTPVVYGPLEGTVTDLTSRRTR